jgi:hypothetical protein
MTLVDAFQNFQSSAFRLETLPAYDVPDEVDELEPTELAGRCPSAPSGPRRGWLRWRPRPARARSGSGYG